MIRPALSTLLAVALALVIVAALTAAVVLVLGLPARAIPGTVSAIAFAIVAYLRGRRIRRRGGDR
ncbi:hypothetical protein [Actinomadura atramentaria]|uniref:hypothetical protein n=1 Tax=Actinomadura atramentaria TaxID=1990 RepID=UPI00036AE361|nr:hypothetical protein [Actinomadura atramentaria]